MGWTRTKSLSLAAAASLGAGMLLAGATATAAVPAIDASTGVSKDLVQRKPAVKNKIGQGRAVLHIDVDLATVKKVGDRTYRMVLPRDAAGQWMGERTDASGKERVLVGDLTAAQLAKRWSDFRYGRDAIGASLIWDTGSRLIRLGRPVETDNGIRFDFRSARGIPSTLSGVSLNLERAPEAGSRAARYGNQSATYTIVTSNSSTSPTTSLMFSWNYNQGGGTAATSGKSRIYNLNTNGTCWSNTTSYSGSKSVVSIPSGSCANVAYSNGSGSYGIELFGPGCTADIAYTPPGQNEYWWQQTLPGC